MPALAAAAIQHEPPRERLGPHRRDPPEKLLAVLRPDFCESRPLVAEALRHDRRVAIHRTRYETRNPAHDRIARIASFTAQGAITNLPAAPRAAAQRQAAVAGRAREPLDQALAHQAIRCRRVHSSRTSSV